MSTISPIHTYPSHVPGWSPTHVPCWSHTYPAGPLHMYPAGPIHTLLVPYHVQYTYHAGPIHTLLVPHQQALLVYVAAGGGGEGGTGKPYVLCDPVCTYTYINHSRSIRGDKGTGQVK